MLRKKKTRGLSGQQETKNFGKRETSTRGCCNHYESKGKTENTKTKLCNSLQYYTKPNPLNVWSWCVDDEKKNMKKKWVSLQIVKSFLSCSLPHPQIYVYTYNPRYKKPCLPCTYRCLFQAKFFACREDRSQEKRWPENPNAKTEEEEERKRVWSWWFCWRLVEVFC